MNIKPNKKAQRGWEKLLEYRGKKALENPITKKQYKRHEKNIKEILTFGGFKFL